MMNYDVTMVTHKNGNLEEQARRHLLVAGRWQDLDPWPLPLLKGVRIDGKYLLLEYGKPPYVRGRPPSELASASHEMLTGFANLGEDHQIMAFAARYGGLGLCGEHGWPFAHTRPHCPSTREETKTGVFYREPLELWFSAAKLAKEILTALDKGNEEMARVSRRWLLTQHRLPNPYTAIQHWLANAELRIGFAGRPLQLRLYGIPPLWVALGLQLASVAVKAKRVALCVHCLRLFTPDRESRRSFCPKCKRIKKDVRNLYAVRDRRERIRIVLRLQQAGKNAEEIVSATGFPVEQVKRYLDSFGQRQKEKETA